ncbi:uncharacterized protein LOC108038186 [Drosophila rhopaloa]|uniref:Uncharacterized protein LOC108038186 n=1 Tax=Drosophila rhopaloa TaxID=1041015 RepID=A0A6P4EAQ7_DRORH|nr:uncharacterized protein LOC108038186 [Drosophila rhopaloa]
MSFYLRLPSGTMMVVLLLMLAVVTDDVHAKHKSKSKGIFSIFRSGSSHSNSHSHSNSGHSDSGKSHSGSSYSSYHHRSRSSSSGSRRNNTDDYQYNTATKAPNVPQGHFLLIPALFCLCLQFL